MRAVLLQLLSSRPKLAGLGTIPRHQGDLDATALKGGSPQAVRTDDFSFRKRHRYGALIIDLNRSQLIALLKDRETQTVADWLAAHPGAEVVARDRFQVYKVGIAQGMPAAIQVADRFHLTPKSGRDLGTGLSEPESRPKAVETIHHLNGILGQTEASTVPDRSLCNPRQRSAQSPAASSQTSQAVPTSLGVTASGPVWASDCSAIRDEWCHCVSLFSLAAVPRAPGSE